jgi:hypothetical protein
MVDIRIKQILRYNESLKSSKEDSQCAPSESP